MDGNIYNAESCQQNKSFFDIAYGQEMELTNNKKIYTKLFPDRFPEKAEKMFD